jgi:glycosyltransferase involved in cell wall biosynthesis
LTEAEENRASNNGEMESLRVALVGVYPPPFGGVSIHIQRLLAGCLANNIRCTVFDRSWHTKKDPNVLNLLRIWNLPRVLGTNQDIYHVHTVNRNWQIPMLFNCLAGMRRARLVLTYHALRYSPQDFSPLGLRMTQAVLKSASHCIAVNSGIKDKLLSMGAGPEKVSVIPAYLPPVQKEEEKKQVPPEVWTFMENHAPLVCANAFAIIRDKGEDLYGIDMCIELCAALKSIYAGVGLVFLLPSIRDHEYFHELKRRISRQGIERNFFFQTKPCQFYPVLMKSDVFVRPTSVDGDAVSLREALYFKIPSVASDAVARPEDTVLFGNRDTNDFILKVREVLADYEYHKKKLETAGFGDFFPDIMRVYREVAEESAGKKTGSSGKGN